MNYDDYTALNDKLNAYLSEVIARAAVWINENTGYIVDNTFTNPAPSSCHAGLPMLVKKEDGTFTVWLTRNNTGDFVDRVRVPSSLLEDIQG